MGGARGYSNLSVFKVTSFYIVNILNIHILYYVLYMNDIIYMHICMYLYLCYVVCHR